MLIQILILVCGLALTVLGADWLVDGASSVAKKLGVSDFVIGLTIVGFGTSCPELVVSLTGAIQGNADISVGNVVGSNIMNTLLILGLTALLYPITITESNKKKDIPVNLVVIFLFIMMGMNYTFFHIGASDSIMRWEAAVMLLIFIAYIYSSFKSDSGAEDVPEKQFSTAAAIGLCLLGLGSLVIGGRLFVQSATSIARLIGVSDKFIAITVLAGGTSLPELVTCIVAAAKHKEQIALGNIIGSNIFNILLILGISALVTPLSLVSMDFVDMLVLLLSGVLLWVCTYTGDRSKMDRWEGFILLAVYAAYMVRLFSKL